MKWMARAVALSAAGSWLVSTAQAIITDSTLTPERNYRVIIDRNPFGLKDPPAPPTNAPVVAKPKDEILLTGIRSLGGLRAYFMAKPTPGKKDANTNYFSLGVDQKQDTFEVLSIDPASGSVRVREAGIETVMTFASHGVKAPVATVAPATPHLPGIAGARTGAPPNAIPAPAAVNSAVVPTVTPVNMASSRVRTIPARNLRTRMDPALARRYGLSPGITPDVPPPNPEPDPDAAVHDVIIMEAQKAANPHVEFPPTPVPLP